jgi:hypothetical protein
VKTGAGITRKAAKNAKIDQLVLAFLASSREIRGAISAQHRIA